jgi:hypothetical protein
MATPAFSGLWLFALGPFINPGWFCFDQIQLQRRLICFLPCLRFP